MSTRMYASLEVLQYIETTHNIPAWIKALYIEKKETPPALAPLVAALNRWLEVTQCSELRKINAECTVKLARCLAGVRVFVESDSNGVKSTVCHGIMSTVKAPRFSSSLTLRNTTEFGHMMGKGCKKFNELKKRMPDVLVSLVGLNVRVTADTQSTADQARCEMRAALFKVVQYVQRVPRPGESRACRALHEALEEIKRNVDEQGAHDRRNMKIERKKKWGGEKNKLRVASPKMWRPKGRKASVSGRSCQFE